MARRSIQTQMGFRSKKQKIAAGNRRDVSNYVEVGMLDGQDGIVKISPDGLSVVAKVLAEAFAEDPVFIWAMPKAVTRQSDAAAFFTFYLRRTQSSQREVFATPDRSAVAVMTTVNPLDNKLRKGQSELSSLVRTTSPAADYFRWIETFRPAIPHRYLEFIGSSPASRSKGQGSILLKTLLAMSAREGLPVWCWSSNPRNLPFYHRLDFVAGAGLCRDTDTPAVTPLLRPPVPLAT